MTNKVMVKVLTDGVFDGMEAVVGKTVEATSLPGKTYVRITGKELIANGASSFEFDDSDYGYCFFLDNEVTEINSIGELHDK